MGRALGQTDCGPAWRWPEVCLAQCPSDAVVDVSPPISAFPDWAAQPDPEYRYHSVVAGHGILSALFAGWVATRCVEPAVQERWMVSGPWGHHQSIHRGWLAGRMMNVCVCVCVCAVSYTHHRAHATSLHLVSCLLLDKKKTSTRIIHYIRFS